MDRTLRRVISFVSLAVFAQLAPSCASAPKKDTTMTLEEFERNAPPPDDPCVGAKGVPLECGSQADCCKGYACAKDPERNPRALYCLKE
jgi:hypothetical protein